ncbi:unnamed protein product [Cuscuta campestris]|uniref:Uncharacterized protein n=1 Tax=Cuscuta campestris TaxID=132261 RepID=A0A484MRJ3_9ASTE|nr:unnamed protein product [Cuscuta campestris]
MWNKLCYNYHFTLCPICFQIWTDWKYLSYPFLGSVRYKEYLDRCTKGIGCSIGMIFPCGRKENKIEGEAEEEKQKF